MDSKFLCRFLILGNILGILLVFNIERRTAVYFDLRDLEIKDSQVTFSERLLNGHKQYNRLSEYDNYKISKDIEYSDEMRWAEYHRWYIFNQPIYSLCTFHTFDDNDVKVIYSTQVVQPVK